MFMGATHNEFPMLNKNQWIKLLHPNQKSKIPWNRHETSFESMAAMAPSQHTNQEAQSVHVACAWGLSAREAHRNPNIDLNEYACLLWHDMTYLYFTSPMPNAGFSFTHFSPPKQTQLSHEGVRCAHCLCVCVYGCIVRWSSTQFI